MAQGQKAQHSEEILASARRALDRAHKITETTPGSQGRVPANREGAHTLHAPSKDTAGGAAGSPTAKFVDIDLEAASSADEGGESKRSGSIPDVNEANAPQSWTDSFFSRRGKDEREKRGGAEPDGEKRDRPAIKASQILTDLRQRITLRRAALDICFREFSPLGTDVALFSLFGRCTNYEFVGLAWLQAS